MCHRNITASYATRFSVTIVGLGLVLADGLGQEVAVSKDGLLIRLRLHGLNSLVGELVGDGPVELAPDGQIVDVRVPMEFKTRAGRREIILPANAETGPKAEPNQPLVLALARAHRWQGMLDSGEAPGVEAIAAQHGVDRTYVSRILGLAMLAPEAVVAIAKGNEPSGLSLRKLTAGPLPVRWDEQQAALGL